jgi:hypothetical protein
MKRGKEEREKRGEEEGRRREEAGTQAHPKYTMWM